ncbi:MAG: XRE family transcriptional regulator [Candidatus Muiribacteriota bacterium]
MIKDRFKKLRKKLNISQKKLAEKINVPVTAISKYENGKIKPSSEVLKKLLKNLNVNINWILMGSGDMLLYSEDDSETKKNYNKYIKNSHLTGLNNNFISHRLVKNLKKELNINARIFLIKDDSMSPTLNIGDSVLVNFIDKIHTCGIYAFMINDNIFINRVQEFGKDLQLIFDNTLYQNYILKDYRKNKSFKLLGEVVWHCRIMKK